jgi:hypothetical protein
VTARVTPARVTLAVAAVALLAWLGVRTGPAFDVHRHQAAAAAVRRAPNVVTWPLRPSPALRASGLRGSFQHLPRGWLSVLTLQGLEPVRGKDRYLVFLRGHSGWSLAAAARPGPDGSAQVRFGAEPRASSVFEVLVTVAPDDAGTLPHGTPVLHWFDPRFAHAGPRSPEPAVPF